MAHATSKLDCRFTTSAADIENALAGLNAGAVHCPASERGDLLVNDRMPFEPATSRFSVPFFALRCVRDNRCVKSHLYQLRLCESRFDVRGPDRIRRNKLSVAVAGLSSSLGLRVRCKCRAPSWLGRIR